ncbi:hypothetical protein F8M41_002027 [Gigaspora margarita]|uniref:F-box domain-containing protein n=1 Tax=Gigaspora margarita TaxID=4874 RepID=A0A8H4AYU3_GIGMA|nr:hypothetical protein F8M41_002027 [Gigaspora margarita]
MISIPNECFFEIFNHFQDCYNILFSCLLVNRQWCRNIVPILWKNPLKEFRDVRIIKTYLLSLNAEEKAQLRPFGIVFPIDPKPLFDYTAYTTSIVEYNLCEGIKNCLDDKRCGINYYSISDDYERTVRVIKSSLISMLLRTSKNLKLVDFYETINDKIMMTLIEILYRSTAIKTLNICFDNLGSKEGKMLVEALHRNITPESLRINDYQLGINEGKANYVKFDFTEPWLSITYNKNEEYHGTYLNSLYVTGSLPTSIDAGIPKCKKIEITCESHDQGWSSYPQDQGTYNNSWTWGEISIIPKQNNDLQGHLIENESKTRYKVYTNKHAVEDWQTHKFVFLSEHPLVQSLQPGDIVGLYIRSLHPGWCNYNKRAEIKFYYTV